MPVHQLPDWRLSFVLPQLIAFSQPLGPIEGVIGAHIADGGMVEIRGKVRDWVLAQAALAWSKLCRYHAQSTIDAVLAREDEPGPAISGPLRKGTQITCRLAFDGHTTVMVWGSTMRRVSYPVAVR